ncbi:MAG: hypothetical protein ACFFEY_07040 [Candidatus Thorarchaeota archaeon]
MKNQISNKFHLIFIKIKILIYQIQEKYPIFTTLLEHIYYFSYNISFFIRIKFRLIHSRREFGKTHYSKKYQVNPEKLTYISGLRFNRVRDYLKIFDGDWDLSNKMFIDSYFFKAFQQRIKEGKEWKQTDYYQIRFKNLVDEKGFDDSTAEKKLGRYFSRLESLYYDVNENGFKSKREMMLLKGWIKRTYITNLFDEISIAVGRDGQLLTGHGKHRLSIAKLINIDGIPIIIIVRHKKWVKFKSYLIQYLKKKRRVDYNEILKHPDLQNLPLKKGEISFELIRNNITISKGTILDIGAEAGYFCHKFEDEGYECIALEDNPINLYFLKKLKKIENKKFKIISKSILDLNQNNDLEFDVGLALGTLYNFLQSKESFLRLKELLNKLKLKELILGVKIPKKIKKKDYYITYSLVQFVDFILKYSCLDKAEFIRKTKTGMYLFKLISAPSFS